MVDINTLKFDENGLLPAVVTDVQTGEVLTLAYMNMESLKISMQEGRTCFWSRSRGELWRKGEASGNVQRIVSIKTDCDMDALLITVEKAGPACHLGTDSCFTGEIFADKAAGGGDAFSGKSTVGGGGDTFSLKNLHDIIIDRKENAKLGSYTNYLFDKGIDKILKKFGEEAVEVVIAGKAGDKGEIVYELADLTYHAFVLMVEMGVTPSDIVTELASRHTTQEDS